MNTKSRGLVVGTLLVSMILGIYTIYLFIASRTMIITMGLTNYRQTRLLCLIGTIIFIVLTIVLAITSNVKRKNTVDYITDKKLIADIKETDHELLSISYERNSKLHKRIIDIHTDLNAVLEYYISFEDVIQSSGQFDLGDTDDILAKVLVTMKKNVDHFIRTTKVLYVRDGGEIEAASVKCHSETRDMKNKALDFTTSILDYMHNSDKENMSDALDSINAYKEVILDELSLVDKYL